MHIHKPILLLLSALAFMMTACSDEVEPSDTFKGFFTDSEGGMQYDFYQEPDTTVLILNASKVPCDSTETIEEVPCGDTPVYFGNNYILTISGSHATLTIGTSAHKYDYVTDKKIRTWHYQPGEYILNTVGYEDCKIFAGVYKVRIMKDNLSFKTKRIFFRKAGDKDEVAFVSDYEFTHTEYGPKRMRQFEFPASTVEHHLTVSKEDEYDWVLTGEDVAYRFHIQEWELAQTKPSYKYIGKLNHIAD